MCLASERQMKARHHRDLVAPIRAHHPVAAAPADAQHASTNFDGTQCCEFVVLTTQRD